MEKLTQSQKNINACFAGYAKDFKKSLAEKKTVDDLLASWCTRDKLTKLQQQKLKDNVISVKEAKAIISAKYAKELAKEKAKVERKLSAIYEAEPSTWGLCRIDWVKSRTWGHNPKGEYCNGHFHGDFGGISGCGYDKLSALTAKMFNADKNLLRIIVDYIDKKHLKGLNREELGYGIRTNYGLPYWEGGVGINSHKTVLQNLGFKVTHYDTKSSDIIEFTKNN